MKRILIDTFGADRGTSVIVNGALRALKKRNDFKIAFFGDEEELQNTVSAFDGDMSRIEMYYSTECVTNSENPACVFKGKDNSSLVMALKDLKTSSDDTLGMLSAGSTGALMVGSIARLGLKNGVSQPLLCSLLPTLSERRICIADCGANVNPRPEDLVLYAELASEYYSELYNIPSPKVALLSVGREKGKGSEITKKTYELLETSSINFIGNAEGTDIYSGYADIIICDGFAGNVVIKVLESAGKTALKLVTSSSVWETLSDDSKAEITENVLSKFDLNDRGGATFLGTKKPIIKMHGNASEETVIACIDQLLEGK